MSLVDYAKSEMDLIGLRDDGDEMDAAMRSHIVTMMQTFADEGHSGFSAHYAISLLKRLLEFKPLSELTGNDDEWMDVSEQNGNTLWQNKRYSAVFKDDSGAWNIDGKVFWEWHEGEDGSKTKIYYTSSDSKMPVTFPYSVPEHPIYEYRESENE